jgi:integrase/recombinase XerD
MSKKPVSPLRQRLIDDITARRFGEDTKRDYVRNVRKFAAFLGRSPDTATSEDLRRYQLHMAQQQASPGTINAAIAALRFFFTVTLEKPDLVRPLRTVTKPRKAPVVLSQEEVARRRCHIAVRRARENYALRIFKPPRRPRATWSSPRRVARGEIELT